MYNVFRQKKAELETGISCKAHNVHRNMYIVTSGTKMLELRSISGKSSRDFLVILQLVKSCQSVSPT